MTAATFEPRPSARDFLHPLRALLLAGSVALFLSVLLSDIAYANSDQVQWKNFASWLNVGALVLGGLALLWSVIDLVGVDRRRRRSLRSGALLLIGWLLGFVNSLVHAKDAGATLPEGLVLSVLVFALVAIAGWLGLRIDRPQAVAT